MKFTSIFFTIHQYCLHNIHQHQSPHVPLFRPATQLFIYVQRAFCRHHTTKTTYKSLKIHLKLGLFVSIV